ncbi:MAG: excinuclease ABC subunit UvrC [Chitinophagaceae bacterium]
MKSFNFQEFQSSLPNAPGIYKYYDVGGELIYIGKAKNIKKRVSSYFTKSNHSYKTNELVRRIQKIEFTIVKSEHDALLLENALIKEFKPKYNIELKDDKTYPFIVIKNEAFPRVFLTRRRIQDGSEYLGPYTSANKARELLTFIKMHIPLRTCTLNLSPTNIKKGKYKVCLEYHLGNCKGPCVSLQTQEEYDKGVSQIKHILKGNLSGIIEQYKQEQRSFVDLLAFEKAALVQQKLDALKNYQSSSAVVSPKLGDLDVFALSRYEQKIIVSYLSIRNGTISNALNKTYTIALEETDEDVLSQAIIDIQSIYNSNATDLVLPFKIEFGFDKYTISIPKAGEKKKLLDMAITNAEYQIMELKKAKILNLTKNEGDQQALLEKTQEALSLKSFPKHIECFDNSNFQGAYPVSAMVCFKNGVPSKKDYRHFNVKTVKGINDFATMKEVVTRRYDRLIKENESLPQLVIIDGGKGQLSAAMEAIEELGLTGKMTLIGLAKNVEEIFFAGDQESLKLDFNGEVLHFIRRIRDEVHRFGITFHRAKRSQGTFKNELETIEGIGQKTANDLLTHFRSIANIKKASREELMKIVGDKKAKLITTHFRK